MTTFEVVLTETGGDTVLTPWVTNLSFRSVDPGGFGSATFDLSRGIDAPSFEAQADVTIYNAETGEPVGGGRMVNPGRAVSRSGDVWTISLLGEGVAHMQERKEPYIVQDTRVTPWFQNYSNSEAISWSQGGPPDNTASGGVGGTQGLVFRMEEGTTVGVGKLAEMVHYDIEEFPGAILGGYAYYHVEGRADSNSRIKASSTEFSTTDEDDPFSITSTFVGEDVANVGSPKTRIEIRYERITSSRTATSTDWSYLHDIKVFAMRYDRTSTLIDTGTTYLWDGATYGNMPTTGDVIIDCWARFCPRFDLANARIDDSGLIYDSLVWPDGITPFDVLGEMKKADPGYTWAVWEKQPNGLFRTEWRAYDTDVRYEMTADDGFSETSASTKYVAVYGVIETSGTTGRYEVITYDDPDETLAARGITPSTTVTGERSISFSGLEALLNESELEAGTAQVTVARKVFDHFTGRWVEPFQVFPGYLCRIAGVNPQPDTLNVNQVPGAAVFKIVSNDYSVSSASSRLELNAFTVDERRAIANLLAAQR